MPTKDGTHNESFAVFQLKLHFYDVRVLQQKSTQVADGKKCNYIIILS